MSIRVLGIDPGITNFAYVIIEGDETSDPRILARGVINARRESGQQTGPIPVHHIADVARRFIVHDAMFADAWETADIVVIEQQLKAPFKVIAGVVDAMVSELGRRRPDVHQVNVRTMMRHFCFPTGSGKGIRLARTQQLTTPENYAYLCSDRDKVDDLCDAFLYAYYGFQRFAAERAQRTGLAGGQVPECPSDPDA